MQQSVQEPAFGLVSMTPLAGANPADEVSHLIAGGFRLWASESLSLVWLSRCDNWLNPCLLTDGPAPAGSGVALRSGVRRWFWRVDVTFGARVYRAIHRAGTQGSSLPLAYREDLPNYIINYIKHLHGPDIEREVHRIALAGPVPLDPIPAIAFDAPAFGVGWETPEEYERLRAKHVAALPPLVAPTPSREPTPRVATRTAKPRAKSPPPASGLRLFDPGEVTMF